MHARKIIDHTSAETFEEHELSDNGLVGQLLAV
jgi:hypothetical protein